MVLTRAAKRKQNIDREKRVKNSVVFLTIPPEIRNEVFGHCAAESLLSLAESCRMLKDEIEHHTRLLCKTVYYRNDPYANYTWLHSYIKFRRTLCRQCHIGLKPRTVPPICRDCQEDECRKITKGRAMSEYLLDANDLAQLDCTRVRNPHYSGGFPMKLYTLQDIQSMSYRKFGEGGLRVALEAAEQRLLNYHQAKINAQERRRNELQTVLSLNSLELRSDSKMCKLFINGSKARKLHEVVTLMKKSHIIHQHTDYPRKFQNINMVEVYATTAYYKAILNDRPSKPCETCGDPIFDSLVSTGTLEFGRDFVLPMKIKLAHDGMSSRAHKMAIRKDNINDAMYHRRVTVDKFIIGNYDVDILQNLRNDKVICTWVAENNIPLITLKAYILTLPRKGKVPV